VAAVLDRHVGLLKDVRLRPHPKFDCEREHSSVIVTSFFVNIAIVFMCVFLKTDTMNAMAFFFSDPDTGIYTSKLSSYNWRSKLTTTTTKH
jgi:hypothetical protein